MIEYVILAPGFDCLRPARSMLKPLFCFQAFTMLWLALAGGASRRGCSGCSASTIIPASAFVSILAGVGTARQILAEALTAHFPA